MDPSIYYNTWWNNHNSSNNWYMDPHKNGTGAINPPPPAHNMSGPPQHSGHNMPMGQPIPPRPMQPAYMAPRPAHTGSSVPLAKPTQPPGLLPKQTHPGAPASPKLPTAASTQPQEKSMVSNPLKPVTSSDNLPNSLALGSKVPGVPPAVETNIGAKSIHNLPIPHYHQLMQHQQAPQNNIQHQSLPGQQQINIVAHQMQAQQQQMHHMPHQQHIPQQQMNPQQLPATQQQNNQSQISKPSAPTQNLPNANNKQDVSKSSTPPVPGLISINQSLPASPQNQVAPTPKLPSAENKINQNVIPRTNTTPISNDMLSTNKPTQNTNNATSGSTQLSQKQTEQQKNTNVSILPAKPVSITPKSDVSKPSESTNTVTITPSVKGTETTDLQKTNNDPNATNLPTVGLNQNGMSSVKSPAKVISNSMKPVAEPSKELKVPVPPKAASPSVTTASSPNVTSQSRPANQNIISKQTPNTNLRQSPQPSQPLNKAPSVVKPTQSAVPPSTQVESTTSKTQSLQSKIPSPQSQKLVSPAVSKTPIIQPLPPQPPATTVTSPKISPSKANVATPVPKSPSSTVAPAKENVSTATKSPIPNKQEKTVVSPSKQSTTTPTKREPRIVKKVAEKTPRLKPAKETKKVEEVSGSDDDDQEEDEEKTTNRGRRSKRKASLVEAPQEGERKSKRSRNPAPFYQSPLHDSQTRIPRSLLSTPATPQERLVVFFKNEHVALRNAEGTFYICQIAQNVYKSSRKIKIRWLSPTDESNEKCDTFKPDYYDVTDFDCILTSVAMKKAPERGVQRLSEEERARILNILQRAMDRDNGIPQEKSELREDHPDGLDLSLYNDESQLKEKRSRGKKRSLSNSQDEDDDDDDDDEEEEKEEEEEEEEEESEDEVNEEVEVEEVKRGRGKKGGAAAATATKKPTTAAPKPTKSTLATKGNSTALSTPRRGRASARVSTPTPSTTKKTSTPTETSANSTTTTPSSVSRRRVVRNFGSVKAAAKSQSPATAPEKSQEPQAKKPTRATRGAAAKDPKESPAATPATPNTAKTPRRSRK